MTVNLFSGTMTCDRRQGTHTAAADSLIYTGFSTVLPLVNRARAFVVRACVCVEPGLTLLGAQVIRFMNTHTHTFNFALSVA
jgi:hypothetical protein